MQRGRAQNRQGFSLRKNLAAFAAAGFQSLSEAQINQDN